MSERLLGPDESFGSIVFATDRYWRPKLLNDLCDGGAWLDRLKLGATRKCQGQNKRCESQSLHKISFA